MKYFLMTGGPCPTIDADTLEDAQRKAEKYVVLKKGWSIEWETHPTKKGLWRLTVRNSKGRKVTSCTMQTKVK